MSIPHDLIAAYRAALYDVDAGGGVTMTLRIDQVSAACDSLLRAHNAHAAALITACNPRSRPTSAAENASAHDALCAAVARLGKAALPARGRDPVGEWPVEPGLFILDIAASDARLLAQRFDQHAFVWIEIGGLAALMFTA